MIEGLTKKRRSQISEKLIKTYIFVFFMSKIFKLYFPICIFTVYNNWYLFQFTSYLTQIFNQTILWDVMSYYKMRCLRFITSKLKQNKWRVKIAVQILIQNENKINLFLKLHFNYILGKKKCNLLKTFNISFFDKNNFIR